MRLVAALDHLLEKENEGQNKKLRNKGALSANLPSLLQISRQDNVSVLSYSYIVVSWGGIKRL